MPETTSVSFWALEISVRGKREGDRHGRPRRSRCQRHDRSALHTESRSRESDDLRSGHEATRSDSHSVPQILLVEGHQFR